MTFFWCLIFSVFWFSDFVFQLFCFFSFSDIEFALSCRLLNFFQLCCMCFIWCLIYSLLFFLILSFNFSLFFVCCPVCSILLFTEFVFQFFCVFFPAIWFSLSCIFLFLSFNFSLSFLLVSCLLKFVSGFESQFFSFLLCGCLIIPSVRFSSFLVFFYFICFFKIVSSQLPIVSLLELVLTFSFRRFV